MQITPEEARATLADIQAMTKQVQSLLHVWAYYLVLWGILWTISFTTTQFAPHQTVWIWSMTVFAGMAGSAILGIVQQKRFRLVPGTRAAFLSTQYGLFNGVLYSFVLLWLILFPLKPVHIAILWITAVMFSSIMAGIWLRQTVSIVLGVSVTVVTVMGYYLLPAYFWLWAATSAGLPLIGVGLYFLSRTNDGRA
ncbi:MAG: hypothetical protein IMW89_05270 [Ktedonobacteraceae bacterium]|nr:hypothetical protein [Ktedonobacteraceae bacterium]